MSVDYPTDLEKWVCNDYYDDNVHKIQLPYATVSNEFNVAVLWKKLASVDGVIIVFYWLE